MLNKNIKHFRKAKGLSQEEIAIKLNVVRQTISKWEKGLSVPDADVLIHMAELLDVSVGNLLGIEPDRNDRLNLSEELERLNEQLAPKTRWEKINSTISFKRITKVVRRCCPSAHLIIYLNLRFYHQSKPFTQNILHYLLNGSFLSMQY